MANNIWTRGLDPSEAKNVEETLKNSHYTLDIVRKMVYNIYVDSFSTNKSDYEKPAWAYYKANQEGRQESLEKILEVLDLKIDNRLNNPKQKALTDDRTKQLSTSED